MNASVTRHRAETGFALISVLIALSILLALLVPFLSSVLNESRVSGGVIGEEVVHLKSQGVRDRLLYMQGQKHPSREFSVEGGTPDWDGLDEFPKNTPLPDAFTNGGRSLHSSAVEDLQRKIHLPTASPLVLANLLGLATSLSGDHEPDVEELTVEEAESFPAENGTLFVYGERIGYELREGNVFRGLRRQWSPAPKLPADCLVLDYRVVLAVTYQFERDPKRGAYVPYSTVHEVQEIGNAAGSVGRFTKREMDILLTHCTTHGINEYAARWGKPERMFSGQDPSTTRNGYAIRTKSALGLGGGAIIKITSIEDPRVTEYNFVWRTQRPTSTFGSINLQGSWQLNVLFPPSGAFNEREAMVQALTPVAVNINTAERDVLVALLQNLRKGPTRNQDHAPDPADTRRQYGPKITARLAGEMADELIALRSGADQDSEGGQPFKGVQDLTERFFHPRGKSAVESSDMQGRQTLVMLLLNMLYGRSPSPEMGTMPITFSSSSLVRYRVATMETKLSGLESARNEILGVASAMPGQRIDSLLFRQRDWLENIRLTRRAPHWLTFPTSVGSIASSDLGSDPAEIAPGLLYAKFFPTAGFGNPRYPSQERGAIRAGTVTAQRTLPRRGRTAGMQWSHEQFRFAQSPDGRDIAKEGPFDMINTGPRNQGGGGANRPRHPDASFRYTVGNEGMPGRHAVSFWFRLDGLGDQCLYDMAAEIPDRNRINLRLEAGHLVFEVLDEAGVDPNPSDTLTAPQRSAGLWRVPLQDVNLQPQVWYHANIAADGNRPDQLSLFLDGVPRGKPEFLTYTTAEIPLYERPDATVTPAQDKARYPEILVESTAGFPEQGVLRIGRELFEYTSKSDTSFICRPVDSMGGRKARMGWREYNDVVASSLDQNGRPTIGENDPRFGNRTEERTPAIASGAAVELYGYAAALYRNRPLTPLSTALRDSLGTFNVARVQVQNAVQIAVETPRGPFTVGKGLDLSTAEDLILVDPMPDERGKGVREPKAQDNVVNAFPASGGYCLLVQNSSRWTARGNNVAGEVQTGGMEIIKYASRQGNELKGIERAARIPGTDAFYGNGSRGAFTNGQARQFVTEWDRRLRQQVGGADPEAIPLAELQAWVLYVVPISIAVQDTTNLSDPLETETTEWLQIYPGKNGEQNTEWVRYDAIGPGGHVVRCRPNAFRRLHNRLTAGQVDGELVEGGGSVSAAMAADIQFEAPQDDGLKQIGYVDQVELDWPIAYAARLALDFRGDRFGRTSSHPQNAGAVVTPCHRLEIDWGPLGAMSARCGRNDRVALVGGTQAAANGQRPALEWHTVNWFVQRRTGDNLENANNNAAQNGAREMLGLYPFQMVAFKAGVTGIFVGPSQRQDFLDTRRVDRIVKFPSGELPAAYVESGWFGGASKSVGDYTNASGMVDEVSAVHKSGDTLLLNVDVSSEAMEIPIRKHTRLYSYGTIGVSQDLTQTFPNQGGLIQIDNEILAYQSYSDGIFQIAQNGRGLLGTEARAHADCSRVQFLTHVPAAILSGPVSAVTNELSVQSLGSLPRFGGTVLMGVELLHYTWTMQDVGLGMPNWYDPDDEQATGVGLFRGRYGTPAQTAPAASPLIWFPTRYWDRYHERSDDPELSYYQATRQETPVFFTGVQWKEENPAPSFLKLITTVNIDGAGSYRDDPEKVMGLFQFDKGLVDDQPNKLGWQGSRIETRFATKYLPGAFDPQSFLSNGWKQAITVRDLIINYEGKTRILQEEQSSR